MCNQYGGEPRPDTHVYAALRGRKLCAKLDTAGIRTAIANACVCADAIQEVMPDLSEEARMLALRRLDGHQHRGGWLVESDTTLPCPCQAGHDHHLRATYFHYPMDVDIAQTYIDGESQGYCML